MTYLYTSTESPIGPLTLVSDGENLVGLYMQIHRHAPEQGQGWTRDDEAKPFAQARKELADYFAGTLTSFSTPVRAAGTPFQERVWAALMEIPYGETWSYGQLAAHIGNPDASRAVGLANGRNPVSILIPCHRVIGANGKLTGYGGGLDRKETLLALERGLLP